jgi:hypothetical protein
MRKSARLLGSQIAPAHHVNALERSRVMGAAFVATNGLAGHARLHPTDRASGGDLVFGIRKGPRFCWSGQQRGPCTRSPGGSAVNSSCIDASQLQACNISLRISHCFSSRACAFKRLMRSGTTSATPRRKCLEAISLMRIPLHPDAHLPDPQSQREAPCADSNALTLALFAFGGGGGAAGGSFS